MSAGQARVGPETIDACRRGDREAFRALYDAYKDKVYSIALYSLRGDADAASDVTQQVFVKLMNSIGQFRGDAGFSTWLHRIVVNACLDAQRGAKSRPVATDPAILDTVAQPQSHEDEFTRAQTAQAVQRAVSCLPPGPRMAILLRYFGELSYEEIAEALHCSIGTVASRLSRGHHVLAKTLAPLRPTLGQDE